jgi:hypoxanthine phosphoribosyltransferase
MKYTWQEFERDVQQFLIEIQKQQKTYNSILAIPRGGLTLGVRLSHELNIPLILGGARSDTLVVDDICDTGNALLPYINRCDTLTIFRQSDCPIDPTFWLHVKEKDWIRFPWETGK